MKNIESQVCRNSSTNNQIPSQMREALSLRKFSLLIRIQNMNEIFVLYNVNNDQFITFTMFNDFI